MTGKLSAIVQQGDGDWSGLTFRAKGRRITDLNMYSAKSVSELDELIAGSPCAIALDDESAFLVGLTFPFTGRKRIKLVIMNELEERLPVPLDDMIVAFKETGRGKVLCATMPKSVIEGLDGRARRRHITLRSLAALYALRRLNAVSHEDFVFLYCHGSTAVVMGFKESGLHYLRQFYYRPESTALSEAFQEIGADKDFSPKAYVMINDNPEAAELRNTIEQTFHVKIETPSLEKYVEAEHLPQWLWTGIGSGLLSADAKNEIDLSQKNSTRLALPHKAAIYVTGLLAALSILLFGLVYLDSHLKQKAYQYLSGEPNRLFRLSFPKSPPVRDAAKAFQEKTKAFERKAGAGSGPISPLALLNQLSTAIDNQIDVKLNELTIDEKEFSISGTTVSFAAAEKIKASLDGISGISGVEISSIELLPTRQVKFTMRGTL